MSSDLENSAQYFILIKIKINRIEELTVFTRDPVCFFFLPPLLQYIDIQLREIWSLPSILIHNFFLPLCFKIYFVAFRLKKKKAIEKLEKQVYDSFVNSCVPDTAPSIHFRSIFILYLANRALETFDRSQFANSTWLDFICINWIVCDV